MITFHTAQLGLHVISRALLLWKLLWEKSCRSVSLITVELLLIVYLTRYLDLLYLFENFFVEMIKVRHATGGSCVHLVRWVSAQVGGACMLKMALHVHATHM